MTSAIAHINKARDVYGDPPPSTSALHDRVPDDQIEANHASAAPPRQFGEQELQKTLASMNTGRRLGWNNSINPFGVPPPMEEAVLRQCAFEKKHIEDPNVRAEILAFVKKEYSAQVYAEVCRAQKTVVDGQRKTLDVCLLILGKDMYWVTTTRVHGTHTKIRRARRVADGARCVLRENWLSDIGAEPKANRATKKSKRDEVLTEAKHFRRVRNSLVPWDMVEVQTESSEKILTIQRAYDGDLLTLIQDVAIPAPILRYILLEASAALHKEYISQGYLHNDLKPDNIFLDAEGNLAIGDGAFITRLDEHRFRGTPEYMPANAAWERTPEGESWSLAVTLVLLASRKRSPFRVKPWNTQEWEMKHLSYAAWHAALPRVDHHIDLVSWSKLAQSRSSTFDSFFLPMVESLQDDGIYVMEKMLNPDEHRNDVPADIADHFYQQHAQADADDATAKAYFERRGRPLERQAEDALLHAYDHYLSSVDRKLL